RERSRCDRRKDARRQLPLLHVDDGRRRARADARAGHLGSAVGVATACHPERSEGPGREGRDERAAQPHTPRSLAHARDDRGGAELMDLNLTPDEQSFRDEFRAWLQENVFEAKTVDELKRWQRTLFEGGWAGISWPKQYGGRGATLMQQA